MSNSDMEYLLLKEKGPYHEVYVRRRLNNNPGLCKFYSIVITVITVSLLLLLFSLVYVFVLIPSWKVSVLSWDGRPEKEARTHVLTHTHCGLAEGVAEKGVYVFKGIPYAVPPVGFRRWREPEMISRERGTCWKGTFQAKKFGSSCVQPRAFNKFSSFVGNEDCLFVNVWTQSLDPLANRPVIFWIHGGDFLYGSGNALPMSPTPEVTKSTKAVYVSVNYRLGPFGFLALDVLSENSSSGTSGNYGVMDVILALEWVQQNIRNFGGNPLKVTVLGQGSGATVIQALLASFATPQFSSFLSSSSSSSSPSFSSSSSSFSSSTALFHRAWLASGTVISNKTSSQAGQENRVFLNITGCSDAGCLRRMSSAEVMGATVWHQMARSPVWGVASSGFGTSIRGPGVNGHDGSGATLTVLVDGHILKESPLHAWKHGRGKDIPVVFTTTAHEIDLLPFDPTISSWTWQHYKATVLEQLTSSSFSSSSSSSSSMAHSALQFYPPDPTLTPEYQYTSLFSDIHMTCPTNILADVAAGRFRSPVYRAVVTDTPSAPVNLLNVSAAHYAFHGWDLLAFFGDFASFGLRPTSEDLGFQRVMREQLVAFARDGKPEAAVWDNARMCTALLLDHVFPVEHYNKGPCDFWLKNGVFNSIL